MDPYEQYYNTPEFIADWIENCDETDGCSTGPLKKLARLFVKRVYKFCCCDHDFDYRYGHKYGMTMSRSDADLRDCIKAAGFKYYFIAQIVYIGVRVGSGPFWKGPKEFQDTKTLLGD